MVLTISSQICNIKQVKPGFTNYLPRGLPPKNENLKKTFKNIQNVQKNPKYLKNGGKFKLLKKSKKILNC